MQTIDEKNTVFRIFDSASEYFEFASAVPQSRFVDYSTLDTPSFTGRTFSGGWSDVKAAVNSAWTEGIDVVDRMVDELDESDLPQPRSRRRKMRFADDDGDELDYDRLRSGQSYWRTSRRESARGPATITIIVDVGANCTVNHRDILWRGAAAIALTKRLEQAGYRVELWSVDFTKKLWQRGKTFDTNLMDAVCLKRPGDPIDESTLATAVSGWHYRTVAFRAYCSGRLPIDSGLGRHRPPEPSELDHVSRDENRVVIAGAFSYEAAVELIRETIVNLKTH